MSSQEAVNVSPRAATPHWGKGTLDTWRFHRQRSAGHRADVKAVVCGETRR
jgi:hypothetical protein